MKDEQIKEWLANHGEDTEPDFLFEEEKMEMAQSAITYDGSWPVPKRPDNIGVFSKISSKNEFNRVVGDPENWEAILSDDDLYNQWILPNAILLFAKTWFDKVKWKSSIHKFVPFPVFTIDERREATTTGQELEDTPYGRARVIKIIAKASSALEVYLSGGWRESTSYPKKPGPYIVDSIKNDIVREVGADMGYKLVPILVCPYCLAPGRLRSYKTPLTRHSFKQYSCPRCIENAKNLELEIQNAKAEGRKTTAVKKKLNQTSQFKYFIGITCICPHDECRGKFVPLTCADYKALKRNKFNVVGALKNFSVTKDTQLFKAPPQALENFPLLCPYCSTRFTPKKALMARSGFKKKSGHFTGLPTASIWIKRESNTLDELEFADSVGTPKDRLIAQPDNLSSRISARQRIDLLINEMVIRMAKANQKSFDGLMTLYFCKAATMWMDKYWEDASRYFFGWSACERNLSTKEMARNPGKTKKKVTNTCRGLEITIHSSFFQEWIRVIEGNINKLHKVNSEIKKLRDLGWFCRPPRFSGGPESVFASRVSDKLRISNKTNIKSVSPWNGVPRLAKVLSIYKIDDVDQIQNYVTDIKEYTWHSIELISNTSLKKDDRVRVKALMMSGHPTHTPIQRIIRLRSVILKEIIDKILQEEATGNSDVQFWKAWREEVKIAREKTSCFFEEMK